MLGNFRREFFRFYDWTSNSSRSVASVKASSANSISQDLHRDTGCWPFASIEELPLNPFEERPLDIPSRDSLLKVLLDAIIGLLLIDSRQETYLLQDLPVLERLSPTLSLGVSCGVSLSENPRIWILRCSPNLGICFLLCTLARDVYRSDRKWISLCTFL